MKPSPSRTRFPLIRTPRLWAIAGLRLVLALLLTAVAFTGALPAPARADTALPPIPAGTNPNAVAVDPVTNKIYVANQDGTDGD